MQRHNGSRAAVLAAGVLAGLLAAASPAAASCAPPPPMEEAIEQAESVFVGTVESVSDERYRAAVRVEEVWKGPDLPPEVEVHGSSGGSDGVMTARSSVDRRFTDGARYLFVLRDASMPLHDNVCSSTSEWREEFSRHRPADAREPVAASGEQPGGSGGSDGDMSTTGGDADSEEPTMVGTGPDEPVTSDDLPGADDPDSVVHEVDGTQAGEVDAEPASSAGGVDARLLLVMAVGLAALAGAAWWLRRET